MNRKLDVWTSWAVSISRLGSGLFVGAPGPRPARTLILYEFEACPFCRNVREALTALDLEVEIRPCPKGGNRFRDELKQKTGRTQFPYFEDPNTGAAMFESNDIIAYLYQHYGSGRVPPLRWSAPATVLSAPLAGLLRPASATAIKSRAPALPLELYSFEISPYCRIAREALCRLEIPYRLHNVGKHSPSRKRFVELSGKMMVPFLIDPNTGAKMFESADIKAYLHQTYAL